MEFVNLGNHKNYFNINIFQLKTKRGISNAYC